jgi:hypothetical protein
MSKIIWYSQHSPLPIQIVALERLFGDIEIDRQGQRMDDASNIIRYFGQSGAAEIVVVAPLSVIGKICEAGIKPLWADMVEVDPSDADVVIQKRRQGQSVNVGYKFQGFKRVIRLNLEFEDVQKPRQ